MPALGTVDMVAARVGELIETDSDIALAEQILAEASSKARLYGSPAWVDYLTAPEAVVAVVVAATARAYQNPGGFDKERADMASFDRTDAFSGLVEFTPGEIAILQMAGGRGGIVSIPLGNPEQIQPRSGPYVSLDRGHAPVDWGGNKPFPLGTDGWLG